MAVQLLMYVYYVVWCVHLHSSRAWNVVTRPCTGDSNQQWAYDTSTKQVGPDRSEAFD